MILLLLVLSFTGSSLAYNQTYRCRDTPWIIQLSANNASGYIESPNYGSRNYPPLSVCTWTIHAPPGTFVTLTWLAMDLEGTGQCAYDRVDVSTTNPSVQPRLNLRFCGGDRPADLTLGADALPQIAFVSDALRQAKGFRIQFTVSNSSARCPHGQRQCRDRRGCYTNRQHCDWKDDCRDGTDEELCGFTSRHRPRDCGRPIIPPLLLEDGDRVVGGGAALPNSWPWMVSLHNDKIEPAGHSCGGAIINKLWIITAAHCLLGPGSLRAHLGGHERFHRGQNETVRYFDKIVIHPQFNYGQLKNDIALIKLKAAVTFNDYIQPVCLPGVQDSNLLAGTQVYATGMGNTHGTGSSEVLKQVMMPLIGWEECSKMPLTGPLQNNTLCTGFKSGKNNICFGDSGGPLVYARPDRSWSLQGVASWGPRICGARREPSVFTKVSAFVGWIDKVLQSS